MLQPKSHKNCNRITVENLAVTGSADISLFGETRDDLTKNKTFDGGSMTITNRAPFSVDASVYEEDDDAYTNTEGNSERLWEVRPEDEEVYLGTLTYTNDFLEPIDFGETAVGSIIDITLDTPAQGKLRGNGNFFLDIDQEREGAETLELGFRGKDPNNFEFISTDGETTGVIPYRFDFVGGRISGSGEEIDPSFTFTVEDNSTASIDLYGRVFALDNGDLPVNDGGDSGSEGNTPIDTGEDEPDTEIEDGTDSEAEGDTGTDSGVGEEDDDSGDTNIPVDTDTDIPEMEGEIEDGTDSEPDDATTNTPTIQDTITALQDQIEALQPLVDQGIISQEILDDLENQVEDLLEIANEDGGDAPTPTPDDNNSNDPSADDSPDVTPNPDGDTDSDVGEDDVADTPVDTDEPDIEEGVEDSTDSSPDDTTPGENSPVTEGELELSIDLIDPQPVEPSASTDAATSVVTVSGSGIPNQEVELAVVSFDPDAFSDILKTTADAEGNWSIEIPEPLIDGEYTLIATQFELDRSDLLTDQKILNLDSSPVAVEITSISEDTGVDYNPAVPTDPNLVPDEDERSVDNDFRTSDNTLIFNGTAEAGSEVELFVDDESIGTTTTDAQGEWSYDYTDFEFDDGEYELTATATNSDGEVVNTPDSTPLLEVDTDYDITLDFDAPTFDAIKSIEDRQQLKEKILFEAEFWESVISNDVTDVSDREVGDPEKGGLIDDLKITFRVEPLLKSDNKTPDGAGGTLATTNTIPKGAFPEYIRLRDPLTGQQSTPEDYVPYHTVIVLDSADLQTLVGTDYGAETIRHEIAHAVGFNSQTFLNRGLTQEVGRNDQVVRYGFTGANALSIYKNELGGKNTHNTVPLESLRRDPQTGEDPTGFPSHWNEWVFPDIGEISDPLDRLLARGNIEFDGLMTPSNPESQDAVLSKLTLGAFQDIGFEVNFSQAGDITVYQGSFIPITGNEIRSNPLFSITY